MPYSCQVICEAGHDLELRLLLGLLVKVGNCPELVIFPY